MRRNTILSLGILTGLVLGSAPDGTVSAQDELFGSPNVQFYINRTRGSDAVNVDLRATVQRDLNRGRAAGGASFQPTFLQNSGAGFGGGVQADKPFSNASHRPTVSPYLNLLRDDLDDATVPNYHTFVRPQLQQIEFQQSQQRQNQMVNRQLQQVQARAGFNPTGSQTMLPTGHPTTYLNLGAYYPALGRRR